MLMISDKKSTVKEPTKKLTVQMRFAKVRLFLNPLNKLIQLGYAVRAKRKTAMGRAMSYHLLNAVEGVYPDIGVNPALAKISDGMLRLPNIVALEKRDDLIVLEWDFVSDRIWPPVHWDDELILCLYDVASGNAAINEHTVIRQDMRMELQLPAIMRNKEVHLYLMLHDRDKASCSNSKYLGTLDFNNNA